MKALLLDLDDTLIDERHADQCAMIGDDQVRDIEPTLKLGMQAFRVAAGDPERSLLKALEALSI